MIDKIDILELASFSRLLTVENKRDVATHQPPTNLHMDLSQMVNEYGLKARICPDSQSSFRSGLVSFSVNRQVECARGNDLFWESRLLPCLSKIIANVIGHVGHCVVKSTLQRVIRERV